MIMPDDYYPFLVFQAGSHKAVIRKLKNTKKGFASLGEVLRGLGAWVVFS